MKLVRDRIPEIIRQKGETVNVRECEDSIEMFNLLRAKLVEEAQEFQEAKNRADAYEELADVLEVVAAIVATFDPEMLAQVRTLKALNKGTFKRGLVID